MTEGRFKSDSCILIHIYIPVKLESSEIKTTKYEFGPTG